MTELTLSEGLARRIEDRIRYTDFQSVDDYAEFVLSEVVTHAENESEGARESTESRDDVESRLQSLGYLEE